MISRGKLQKVKASQKTLQKVKASHCSAFLEDFADALSALWTGGPAERQHYDAVHCFDTLHLSLAGRALAWRALGEADGLWPGYRPAESLRRVPAVVWRAFGVAPVPRRWVRGASASEESVEAGRNDQHE